MKAMEYLKNNSELLRKAKACTLLQDFISLAKENNVHFEDMSLEQAYKFLNKDTEELSEDLMESVAGGGKYEKKIKKEISERINPSQRSGDFQEIPQGEGEKLLGLGSRDVFLDEKTLKWYKLT